MAERHAPDSITNDIAKIAARAATLAERSSPHWHNLNGAACTDGHSWPAWAELFQAVWRDVASGAAPPYPWYAPWLAIAGHRLNRRAGASWHLLASAAQSALLQRLGQRLAETMPSNVPPPASGQEWAAFYGEYSVLARLHATLTHQWIEATAEVLARLQRDLPALLALIRGTPKGDAPVVQMIEAGLSDPHAHGREVLRLTLASGCSVIYKPRSLAAEAAWQRLLAWCNGVGTLLPLKTVWVLPRQDEAGAYGWMEAVAAAPCVDDAAANRYAERMGMLLALLALLEATDCHRENWIVCGEDPLLVDAEMLLSPRAPQHVTEPERAWPTLEGLLRTGLLPRWELDFNGDLYDTSALGASALTQEQVAHLVSGWRKMVTFLRRHRETLLCANGPLAPLYQLQSRFAPRPTVVYERVRRHLLQPHLQREGVDASRELAVLEAAYNTNPAYAPLRPLVVEEQAALLRQEIPYFTVSAATGAIMHGSQPLVPAGILPPAAAQVIANLHALGAAQHEDEPVTLALLRETLDHPPARILSVDPDSPGWMLAAASAIAADLEAHAITLPGGAANWLAPVYVPAAGLYQHQLLGNDLYAGRMGIAFFLAALAAVTGNSKWRDLALRAMPATPDKANLGAGMGLGGYLYAALQVGRWLAMPDLLDTAWHAVNSLSPDDLTAAPSSLLDGVAGLLVGLLTLHSYDQVNEATAALRWAIACGEVLLARRVKVCQGQSAWRDAQGQMPVGFAHGAAGIGYALWRLHQATGAAIWAEVALEALAYARTSLKPFANEADTLMEIGWCNGAAGIGLAHLASDCAGAATVQCALDHCAPFDSTDLDTLCCGRMGRITLLLEAARRLNCPTWEAVARELAQETLRQARSQGGFVLHDALPLHLHQPTFFRGLAGIGYTLLRLAQCRTAQGHPLPNVLIWESESSDANGSTTHPTIQ